MTGGRDKTGDVMKASDFITKLTELIERYGDLELRISEYPIPEVRADVVFQNRPCGAPYFEIG